MNPLTNIVGLFNFYDPSEHITQTLASVMKENYMLKDVVGRDDYNEFFVPKIDNHAGKHPVVQFYLELNRLGRKDYGVIPTALLPHFLARMSGPAYLSHLFYFVGQTPPTMLCDNVLKRETAQGPVEH